MFLLRMRGSATPFTRVVRDADHMSKLTKSLVAIRATRGHGHGLESSAMICNHLLQSSDRASAAPA
jgi:hypothetical protein